MKSNAAEKDKEISSEEKEQINNFIHKFVIDVRTKDSIIQELERKILELDKLFLSKRQEYIYIDMILSPNLLHFYKGYLPALSRDNQ